MFHSTCSHKQREKKTKNKKKQNVNFGRHKKFFGLSIFRGIARCVFAFCCKFYICCSFPFKYLKRIFISATETLSLPVCVVLFFFFKTKTSPCYANEVDINSVRSGNSLSKGYSSLSFFSFN